MNENEVKNEIVKVARGMLDGKIDLLIGCRVLTGLQPDLNESEQDILMPFCAIDSETDHLPYGVSRDLCDREYLERVDREIEHYLEHGTEYIKTACQNVIKHYLNC
jgi:hypothetical protein